MSSNKKNALGRGLSALLEDSKTDITTRSDGAVVGAVTQISIDQIETNPFQPRTHFEEQALLELSESIQEHGVIQPITVRKLGYDKFQLISGERRFRASKLAGMTEIPAYIRIANDQAMLEMAIVENVQREDLDAIEVALSYKRLIDECNLTQEALSKKISKQRSTIANFLRLLKLPAAIQAGIRDGQISMGHARALINIEDEAKQLELFKTVIENELSVRDTEALAKGEKPAALLQKAAAKSSSSSKSGDTDSALPFDRQKNIEEISTLLNTKVDLKINNKGGGRLVIDFKSSDDLQKIFDYFDI
jgi:ParB family transcriptional regulator, chromosome partitioning protein